MVNQQSCVSERWDVSEAIYMSSRTHWWPIRHSGHWRSLNLLSFMLVTGSWYVQDLQDCHCLCSSGVPISCLWGWCWELGDGGGILRCLVNIWCVPIHKAVIGNTRLPKNWHVKSISERTPLNAVWSHTKAQLGSWDFNWFLTTWFKEDKVHYCYG